MIEEKIYHLHPSQQDVFTDQLLDLKSPQYNIGGYIKLKGRLNKQLFNEAVGSGAQVFDAFRMRFDLNVPEPVCFVQQQYNKLDIQEIDFSSPHYRQQEAVQWMQDHFNTPFVIEKETTLVEHYLLKIAEDEYWFFGKYHHLISDGYGFVVWVQYLAAKYRSLVSGDHQSFIFPSYAEEVAKAYEYKKSDNYEADGQYWKNNIKSKPEKFLQRKYNNKASKKSETYFLTLNDNQRKLLEDIELNTKIRLHHLTIGALLIYFGKILKQAEFVFGIPVHKRGTREARNIVGMFSGIIPFKGNFQSDVKLIDLLKNIVDIQKEDYKFQNYAIGDLARALKINSSEGYLFDITINYKLLNFELSFDEEVKATICELANEFQKNPLQLCWQ
ncbi:MAG: condensation domain-containing protein, partial [Bacteroidota bacterium]|nr:condensation domain-containing protein [Bacteroidota bacterium]